MKIMESPEELSEAGSVIKGPGSEGHGLDQKMDVQTMLATLSEEHRNILVLRELQGLSYDEIAEALSIPRGTVESRLHRARQQLKQKFSGYLT